MLYYDYRASAAGVGHATLTTQADILGRASAPALSFDDRKTALDNLKVLNARPEITASGDLYRQGQAVRQLLRARRWPARACRRPAAGRRLPDRPARACRSSSASSTTAKSLGTVYLRASHHLPERLRDYVMIMAAVMAASLLVAVGLSYRAGTRR